MSTMQIKNDICRIGLYIFALSRHFTLNKKITAANFQMKDTAAVIRLFFNPDAIRPQPI